MGLGPPVFSLYKFMIDQGLFEGVDSVVEIGSQEYDTKRPEYDAVLERLCAQCGVETPPGRDPETGRYKGPAGDLYRLLGCRYASLDIDGRFGAIAFDLNYDRIGEDLRWSSALTTNLGTTEHVFNQDNCFRTIHDLTRPGGLMLHVLPMNNYVNHGLFSYSPTFFDSLAAANGYELLGLWLTAKPHLNLLPPARPRFPAGRSMVIALSRRSDERDFVMPLQLSNPMLVDDAMEARYATTERRDRSSARGLRYDGVVFVDLETFASELLAPGDERLAALAKSARKPAGKRPAAKEKAKPERAEGATEAAGAEPPREKKAKQARPAKARPPKQRSLLGRLFGAGA